MVRRYRKHTGLKFSPRIVKEMVTVITDVSLVCLGGVTKRDIEEKLDWHRKALKELYFSKFL